MFSMFREALKSYEHIDPAIFALLLFVVVFAGIIIRVFRKSERKHHEYMANLPLDGRDSE